MRKMELGQKIKRHRINLGETMAEFGQRFNANKGNVATWEKGLSKPNLKRLRIMADEMGMTVTELLGSDDE
ncbi:transcriptional regulator [Staphylococcus pasteuri]|nr:transcriptional regulator [Staphylococcus pasteuri]PTU85837.1 transcriptional regulator [Staphylococcus pasteuri]RIO36484.1 XRE family transcriptional regulator [Staphylococcus pasteuri]RIO41909.1 XRE family transcriptional regulator [Staphylococcus pasteuri]